MTKAKSVSRKSSLRNQSQVIEDQVNEEESAKSIASESDESEYSPAPEFKRVTRIIAQPKNSFKAQKPAKAPTVTKKIAKEKKSPAKKKPSLKNLSKRDKLLWHIEQTLAKNKKLEDEIEEARDRKDQKTVDNKSKIKAAGEHRIKQWVDELKWMD